MLAQGWYRLLLQMNALQLKCVAKGATGYTIETLFTGRIKFTRLCTQLKIFVCPAAALDFDLSHSGGQSQSLHRECKLLLDI